MANTVAYTSSNVLSGSLKSGVISININDNIIGQNYNWRNGIVFSNQYIIYSDTYTQGIDTEPNAKPCAWACDYNDTALLNLINSLPPRLGQTPYTTLSDAITWLQGQNKYFIVNQNYPTIVTDGLQFNLDAGLTASYPVVGTTAYDTKGTVNGTLTNGTSWTNSGATSVFNFDGTDDYIGYGTSGGGIGGSSEASMDLVLKIDALKPASSAYQQIFGFRNDSTFDFFMLVFESSQSGLTEFRARNSSGTVYDMNPNILSYIGKYVHVNFSLKSTGAKVYFNGVEVATGNWTGSLGSSAPFNIGRNAASIWFLDGNVKSARLYSKQLSQSEVLQNYYLGPIVTSGLVDSYDSGNLVSYPGTSTTWYDLTDTNNGTLTNGITFYLNEGGILFFDGTDDYVSLSTNIGNLGSSDWTFLVWYKANGTANDYSSLISQGFTGGIASGGWALKVKNSSAQNFVAFSYASAFETINDVVTSTNPNDGLWHHIVAKREGATCTLYMDGVSIGTFTVGGSFSFGTGASTFFGYTPRDSSYLNGDLSIIQKYNRALSNSEILQNYNAQRNRFETNQAFATGGSVTNVVENGILYRVHTFSSSGTLTVLAAGKVEVLCVAGGGGGSGNYYDDGAGGGAGGLILNTDYSVSTGNKTVTVGAGGAASSGGQGGDGTNSVFDSLTSNGGGGGAAHRSAGRAGGSGGGSAGQYGGTDNAIGGAGTLGQGFDGGTARGYSGSGGGGASATGVPAEWGFGGNGGNGRGISISGTFTYYAGGGGGYGYSTSSTATGGLGGGGNGGNPSPLTPTNGGVNTGGGGGGGRTSGQTPFVGTASGGSGIVIVRYRI